MLKSKYKKLITAFGARNILALQDWWAFDPNTPISFNGENWVVPEKSGTSSRTPQPTHCLEGDGTAEFFIESANIGTISYSYITTNQVQKGYFNLYYEVNPYGDTKNGYRFVIPSESVFYILVKDSSQVYIAAYRCDESTGSICIQSLIPEYQPLLDSEGQFVFDSENELIFVLKDPEYLNFMQ